MPGLAHRRMAHPSRPFSVETRAARALRSLGPVVFSSCDFRTGGGHMDPAMQHVFYLNFYAILMMAIALVLIRTRQEATAREIDSLRRLANAS